VSSHFISRTESRRAFLGAALSVAGAAVTGSRLAAQTRRDFNVSARRYAYRVAGNDAAEIRVMQNDLVRVTFSTEDIPHSFTIEEAPYRIMKRAEPGKPVEFSFRADQPGRFRFFCNLTADDRCKELQGTLVVTGR
jgi:heme/copper-type cytochrome/quinol oxidase subunit 2